MNSGSNKEPVDIEGTSCKYYYNIDDIYVSSMANVISVSPHKSWLMPCHGGSYHVQPRLAGWH